MNAPAKISAAEAHAIPVEALDDRLAWVGTSGSGKTYNAGTCIERLLAQQARAVIVDPLGVWWGLRMLADGKAASPFKVVIFGGDHGDLPLTENAGPLIGAAAAGMAESCIVDLSEIGTAAGERRFMLGFLKALYAHHRDALLHVIFDEADMWAPQTIREKDGGASSLFAITERIVRRGRKDGFIPWLITQRPAELSKSVLSQADGLISMKLTSSQDRDALDAWISGQAEAGESKRIKATMPTLAKGEGVVWLPGHGVLETRTFPRKITFDSSRAPKRGETKRDVKLKPLDLEALRGQLATVEQEAAANDPAKLRAEIAKLKREATAAAKHPSAAPAAPDPKRDDALREESFATGFDVGRQEGVLEGRQEGAAAVLEQMRAAIEGAQVKLPAPKPSVRKIAPKPPAQLAAPKPVAKPAPVKSARAIVTADPDAAINGPMLKVLEALKFWEALGFETASNDQAAAAAGYTAASSSYRNARGALKSAGLIHLAGGNLMLTEAGQAIAPEPDQRSARERLGQILTGPEAKLIDALPRDGEGMSNDDLAEACGYTAASSSYRNARGRLRTLGAISLDSGVVAVEDWVWL